MAENIILTERYHKIRAKMKLYKKLQYRLQDKINKLDKAWVKEIKKQYCNGRNKDFITDAILERTTRCKYNYLDCGVCVIHRMEEAKVQSCYDAMNKD